MPKPTTPSRFEGLGGVAVGVPSPSSFNPLPGQVIREKRKRIGHNGLLTAFFRQNFREITDYLLDVLSLHITDVYDELHGGSLHPIEKLSEPDLVALEVRIIADQRETPWRRYSIRR